MSSRKVLDVDAVATYLSQVEKALANILLMFVKQQEQEVVSLVCIFGVIFDLILMVGSKLGSRDF